MQALMSISSIGLAPLRTLRSISGSRLFAMHTVVFTE